MPTYLEHLVQAEHNEATYHYLAIDASRHSDWQVTCLFYAALHYVDALLHRSGALPEAEHRRSHGTRVVLAGQTLGGVLAADFVLLRVLSENVRYDAVRLTATDVQTLYDNEFTHIRTHVRAALNL